MLKQPEPSRSLFSKGSSWTFSRKECGNKGKDIRDPFSQKK
jgi:hypothetical protein